MKVRASVKPICDKCKVIKRKGAQTETGLKSHLSAETAANYSLIPC